MKKEFIVQRQGKSFVLYAGLLDLAHQQGLRGVRTEIVQIPSPENGNVAICHAEVTLDVEGVTRLFSGYGDAASNNVAPAMQTCLLRMAETRAKARALRDAVNVGVAAFEELADDDGVEDTPQRPYVAPVRAARPVAERAAQPPARADRPAPAPAAKVAADAGAMTEAQRTAIQSLARRSGVDAGTLAQEKFAVDSIDRISQAQASELIRALNDRHAHRPNAAAA